MSLDLQRLPPAVLTSARAGDRAALELVFRAAAGVIRFYARKRTRLGEPLDEMISVGNLAVFDALRTHRPGKGNFFGWLCWWLDGRMLGALRPRALQLTSLEDEASPPQLVDEEALPDELLALHDDTLALRRAIARLPDFERAAVRAHLEGLTFEEAAARLGCTRETVRQAFHAGLGRLQRELAPERPVAQLFSRAPPGPAKCGTRASYVKGCRCQPCTLANRAYQNRWERRRSA